VAVIRVEIGQFRHPGEIAPQRDLAKGPHVVEQGQGIGLGQMAGIGRGEEHLPGRHGRGTGRRFGRGGGGRRGLVVQIVGGTEQFLEPGGQGRIFHGRGLGVLGQHGREPILGRKRRVEQRFGHPTPAGADMVEQRFHIVGQRHHLSEAEHVAGALEGMHGPKHPRHKFGVGRVFFQLQQGAVQFGEVFHHLFPEKGAGLVVKCHPSLPGSGGDVESWRRGAAGPPLPRKKTRRLPRAGGV